MPSNTPDRECAGFSDFHLIPGEEVPIIQQSGKRTLGESENRTGCPKGKGFVLAVPGHRTISPGVAVYLAAAMLVAALSADGAGAPGRRPQDVIGGVSSSQIVVRLKEGAFRNPAMLRRLATLGRDADPREALGERFRDEARRCRVNGMRPAFSTEFAHPDRAAQFGLDRTYIIEVPAGSDTEAMAEAFARLGDDIEFATTDTIGGVAGADAQFVPNDPSFGNQYAMHNGRCGGNTGGAVCDADVDCGTLTCSGQSVFGSFGVLDADIDAVEAWALHTGDFGSVTIAILDSGLLSHPDLGNNVGPYPNGRIVEGRNTNNPLTPFLTIDECNPRHGTHVTGIAAANGNNGIGIAGVTWGAYVMPIRVVNQNCFGTISHLSDGIRWAADHGADVANMSLQYYGISQAESNTLRDAIAYARAAGMLLVAASGNGLQGGAGVVAYPARAAGTLGVSATNNDDVFCTVATCNYNANYGNEVDISAPGDNIYSFGPNGGYVYLDGTSMATPIVSGVAALVKSYNTELPADDLGCILTTTVDDKGPIGWDNQFGFGRVNALSAFVAADNWREFVHSSIPPDGSIDARKPTDRDGTNLYGWQSIDVSIGTYPHIPIAGDFTVDQQGGVAGAPTIAAIDDAGEQRFHIVLNRTIKPKAWTIIRHVGLCASIHLGFLPGDVNANGTMDGADVVTLLDELNAAAATRALWSLDIDRSDVLTPADLLELVDLYNGAEGYDEYAGSTLP